MLASLQRGPSGFASRMIMSQLTLRRRSVTQGGTSSSSQPPSPVSKRQKIGHVSSSQSVCGWPSTAAPSTHLEHSDATKVGDVIGWLQDASKLSPRSTVNKLSPSVRPEELLDFHRKIHAANLRQLAGLPPVYVAPSRRPMMRSVPFLPQAGEAAPMVPDVRVPVWKARRLKVAVQLVPVSSNLDSWLPPDFVVAVVNKPVWRRKTTDGAYYAGVLPAAFNEDSAQHPRVFFPHAVRGNNLDAIALRPWVSDVLDRFWSRDEEDAPDTPWWQRRHVDTRIATPRDFESGAVLHEPRMRPHVDRQIFIGISTRPAGTSSAAVDPSHLRTIAHRQMARAKWAEMLLRPSQQLWQHGLTQRTIITIDEVYTDLEASAPPTQLACAGSAQPAAASDPDVAALPAEAADMPRPDASELLSPWSCEATPRTVAMSEAAGTVVLQTAAAAVRPHSPCCRHPRPTSSSPRRLRCSRPTSPFPRRAVRRGRRRPHLSWWVSSSILDPANASAPSCRTSASALSLLPLMVPPPWTCAYHPLRTLLGVRTKMSA